MDNLNNWKQQLTVLQKTGVLLGLGVTMSLASAETVYQVTQPSGQVSVTDNIDTAYQLSGGNTQHIKALDNLNAPALNQNTTASQNFPTVTNSPSTPTNGESVSIPNSSTPLSVQPTPLPSLTLPNTALPNTALAQPESQPQPLATTATTISQKGTYRLQLITPEPNMAYHRPAQNIDISVWVSPSLQAGDSIAYSIDGKKIAQTQDLTLTIGSQEVPLDKHTLQIDVLNVLNQPIATVRDDFYVTQNTIAMQKTRKLEQLKKQLKAYDDLPWYQKLAVRLGIQKK